MLKSNSSGFPLEKYGQSKQVKFSFNDTSPKKGSPGIREANKSAKEQPTKNVNQVIQNKVSPRKSVPAHTFTNGSDNSKQAFGKKPFEDSNSSPFYHTEPNNFTPGLGVSNSAARLQDLCPEDKQKIGELIKKLASEKDEKEKLRRELEQRENHYKGLINNLAKENEDVVKDSLDLQSQFRYSLNLLKSFQETTAKQQQKIKTQQIPVEQEYKPQQVKSPMKSPTKSAASFYPQTTNAKGQPLSVSFLNNSKEDVHGVVDENSYVVDKEGKRRLIMEEPGKSERILLQERVNQESRVSPKKETVAEVMKREEKTISEITKLKEDIEYLAHSFKRINFSPVVSPIAGAANKTFQDEDFLRSQQSQLPIHEHRIPSPIKLVENFKSNNDLNMNSRDRYIEEEAHYREQPQIRTAQIKYEDARDTLERPPIFKKGASPTKPPKGGKYDKDANSSSDEDEIAIAQKWLNLRKQKIERINQELTENRMRNEAPTHDTHYTEEPRSAGHRLPRSEQSRRYEEEVRQSHETRAPRGLKGPKMQLNELNDEEIRGLQRDWRTGFPGFKSLRSDGFASAKKESNTILNDKDFFKKRAASSASKAFNVNPAMSPGVVNLNQMNVDDLIQLKKVLDEKINSEKSKNHFESSHGSTGKSSHKPQQLSFYSPTAQFSEQPTYVDTTKSASSAYFSGRMENDYDYQNRYAKAPQRMINEEPPQYERNERRVEYRDNSKHEIPIDTSVMRDFDSIAYTLPKADGYRVTEFSKEQYEPIPQENEESRAEEDSLEVDNTEKLYEEKLKEFLKVRERMLKANKIRDQGVQIESILKSTLRDSKMSNKSRENPLTISTQRQRHLNSPPSIQSLGRPDTAKLSEKDFMLSQELVKHGLQEGLNFMQNNRFARDEIPFEITKRLDSEAKTPDYGYGRSQASIKSSRHPDSEIGEEVEELTDDFYDDKLFDLVEDIEKTESATNIPGQQRKSNISATSRLRGSEVDNEFNSLFNTVRTMFTAREENTTERIRDKLLTKFDKSDLMLSRLSSDEDVSESGIHTQQTLRSDRDLERRISDQGIPRHLGRPSKTDSSIVETDTSVIAINKKIEDMKKNKKWK